RAKIVSGNTDEPFDEPTAQKTAAPWVAVRRAPAAAPRSTVLPIRSSRGFWRIASPDSNAGCFHLRKSGSKLPPPSLLEMSHVPPPGRPVWRAAGFDGRPGPVHPEVRHMGCRPHLLGQGGQGGRQFLPLHQWRLAEDGANSRRPFLHRFLPGLADSQRRTAEDHCRRPEKNS